MTGFPTTDMVYVKYSQGGGRGGGCNVNMQEGLLKLFLSINCLKNCHPLHFLVQFFNNTVTHLLV